MWSDFSGRQLVVFQPRAELDVLGVLCGTEFAQAGSSLLLQQASGYLQLQGAQRSAGQVAW